MRCPCNTDTHTAKVNTDNRNWHVGTGCRCCCCCCRVCARTSKQGPIRSHQHHLHARGRAQVRIFVRLLERHLLLVSVVRSAHTSLPAASSCASFLHLLRWEHSTALAVAAFHRTRFRLTEVGRAFSGECIVVECAAQILPRTCLPAISPS